MILVLVCRVARPILDTGSETSCVNLSCLVKTLNSDYCKTPSFVKHLTVLRRAPGMNEDLTLCSGIW